MAAVAWSERQSSRPIGPAISLYPVNGLPGQSTSNAKRLNKMLLGGYPLLHRRMLYLYIYIQGEYVIVSGIEDKSCWGFIFYFLIFFCTTSDCSAGMRILFTIDHIYKTLWLKWNWTWRGGKSLMIDGHVHVQSWFINFYPLVFGPEKISYSYIIFCFLNDERKVKKKKKRFQSSACI